MAIHTSLHLTKHIIYFTLLSEYVACMEQTNNVLLIRKLKEEEATWKNITVNRKIILKWITKKQCIENMDDTRLVHKQKHATRFYENDNTQCVPYVLGLIFLKQN